MNFLKEAGSKFLDSDAKGETEHKKEETEQKKETEQRTPSTTELFSSAKVVADATKAKMNNQEYDEGKAAEAAADILDGAQHYGKLDETQGIGKIVEQAEDYLHKHSTTKTATPHETSGGDVKKTEEGEEKSGGGLVKLAGSFLK